MKTYNFRDLSVNVIDSWDEVTIEVYSKMLDLETRKPLYFDDLSYMVDFLAIFSDKDADYIMDLDEDTIVNIMTDMDWCSNIPELIDIDLINYNGIDFVVMPREHIQTMTVLEKQTLGRILKDNIGNSVAKVLAKLLAVLVRPGTSFNDPVTGQKRWKQNKLDAEYLALSEEVVSKQKMSDLAGLIDFFFDGPMQSIINLNGSLTLNQGRVESV